MRRTFSAVAATAMLLLGAVTVACGGGGSTSGTGLRITDPSKVQTSTPISGAQVYKLQGEGVVLIGATGSSTTPTAAKTYVVVANDTCAGIASKFSITLDDLLKANRSIDAGCSSLRVGDILRIPGSPTPSTGSSGGPISSGTTKPGATREYKVASGDTCDAIAKNQGTDLTKLQAANPGINCANLQIGQTVKIP